MKVHSLCFVVLVGISGFVVDGCGQSNSTGSNDGAISGRSGGAGGNPGSGGEGAGGIASAGGARGGSGGGAGGKGNDGGGGAAAGGTGSGDSGGFGADGTPAAGSGDGSVGGNGSAVGGNGGKGGLDAKGAGGASGTWPDGGDGRDAPVAPEVSVEVSNPDGLPVDRADAAIVVVGDARGVGPDGPGTDALSPGAQEYVTTYLEPYCARLSECCGQAGLPYSGLAACEAHELGFVKYLDDGSEVVVPSVIQTILAQIKTSCDQPSYALIAAATDGTRTSGQPCVAVDQCAGTPALCLNGTCMTPARGKAGDGCAVTCDDYTDCKWGTSGGKSPNSVCYEADGLRCDPTTNTCVALTAIGAACTDFSECGTHAACSNGTCVALATAGQACGGSQSCGSSLQCISDSTGTQYTCHVLSLAWSGSCSP